MKLRRVAVGLVASAATVLAAAPAPAIAATHGPARHATVASARPAHPGPVHRHRDAVKRSPATVGANSKRDGGHASLPAPASRVVPGVAASASRPGTTVRTAGVAATVGARAPPARQ